MDATETAETWKVVGRGELQLSVLFEQMRREGFEFLVSKPQVVFKIEDGVKLEPMEKAVIDVAGDYMGAVYTKAFRKKGDLTFY